MNKFLKFSFVILTICLFTSLCFSQTTNINSIDFKQKIKWLAKTIKESKQTRQSFPLKFEESFTSEVKFEKCEVSIFHINRQISKKPGIAENTMNETIEERNFQREGNVSILKFNLSDIDEKRITTEKHKTDNKYSTISLYTNNNKKEIIFKSGKFVKEDNFFTTQIAIRSNVSEEFLKNLAEVVTICKNQ